MADTKTMSAKINERHTRAVASLAASNILMAKLIADGAKPTLIAKVTAQIANQTTLIDELSDAFDAAEAAEIKAHIETYEADFKSKPGHKITVSCAAPYAIAAPVIEAAAAPKPKRAPKAKAAAAPACAADSAISCAAAAAVGGAGEPPKPKRTAVRGTEETDLDEAMAWLRGEVPEDAINMDKLKTPHIKAMWLIASGRINWWAPPEGKLATSGCNSRAELIAYLIARRNDGGPKPLKAGVAVLLAAC